MMPKVIRTDHAEIDLLEIWLYIARRSVAAANRMIDKLTSDAKMLAEFPGLGRRRDDIKPGLRSWPVGNYLIFYTKHNSGIVI
jgi:toxin ParE1/3/4